MIHLFDRRYACARRGMQATGIGHSEGLGAFSVGHGDQLASRVRYFGLISRHLMPRFATRRRIVL